MKREDSWATLDPVEDRLVSLGRMASSLVHEVNNPLAAVIMNLDLALEQLRDLEAPLEREAMLEELIDAREAASRVQNILNDLRALGRASDLPRARCHLPHAVDSVLRLVARDVRHRAQITCEHRQPSTIVASEARLANVLIDAVLYVADSIPSGGAGVHLLRVVTDRDEDDRPYVHISRHLAAGTRVDLRQSTVSLGLDLAERMAKTIDATLEERDDGSVRLTLSQAERSAGPESYR